MKIDTSMTSIKMKLKSKSILTASLVAGLLTLQTAFAQVYPLTDGSSLEDVSALNPSHLEVDLAGVEATNLRIDGKVAYVTYNTAGSGSRGAIEAIDISDLRHPRSLNTLKYDQFEFADLAISGNRAYAVGQENLPAHQGAVLKMIDISCPDQLIDLGSLPLDGYAATSINIRDSEAVVSTGDNGSISILDLFPSALPKVRLKTSFPNALFADFYQDHYLALGEMGSTQFVSLNSSTLTPVQQIEISAVTTPSPARFQIRNDIAFVNAEKSGLSIIKLGDLNPNHFSRLSQLSIPGTGNGLDVHNDRVYLAQGEDGLYVVNAKNKSAPFVIGNLNFHFAGESTNEVRFYRTGFWDCDYLLVANGSGGFRVFKIHSI